MLTKKYAGYLAPTLQTDNTSPLIELTNYASGEIAIPAGSTLTTLTFFVNMPAVVAPDLPSTGTYYAAYDATPAAVVMTVAAGRAYPLPSAILGAAMIQIRGNTSQPVGITLKS